jgi:hypothetical protein
MAQLFPRAANTVARACIVVAVALMLGAAPRLGRALWSSPLAEPPEQPVPFSHPLHAGDLGVDCRYCHTSVDESSFAGLPSLRICMTCHAQRASDSPILDRMRTAFIASGAVAWSRINGLPGFVYFDHSIHVRRGVGCTTCHGAIDAMSVASPQMSRCIACHRAPESFLRPREQVFNVAYVAPVDQRALGERLVREYNIHAEQLSDCSVCHR